MINVLAWYLLVAMSEIRVKSPEVLSRVEGQSDQIHQSPLWVPFFEHQYTTHDKISML